MKSKWKRTLLHGTQRRMMAAPIVVTRRTIEPGAPVVLFQTRIFGGGVDNQQGKQYDVARDGRFLINTLVDDSASSPITLLQIGVPRRTRPDQRLCKGAGDRYQS